MLVVASIYKYRKRTMRGSGRIIIEEEYFVQCSIRICILSIPDNRMSELQYDIISIL